jgi:hypothetical protein
VIVGEIVLLNLTTLRIPVSDRLSEDDRNDAVDLNVRYKLYVNPNAIDVLLDECSDAAPVNVLKSLLQTAEALQETILEGRAAQRVHSQIHAQRRVLSKTGCGV